ncbi:hypothetical protein ASAC_0640 [Acidilobus saccharovorans 345-15]|uniref:Uncharacterized protein n=1 Tax=Acidilobus saccharovorans (strain DSM 16705 / JCM 18335 / VKM B-2471 / 345-15) TaxID=666510 RepID=D9Q158_ACIS3|nr:hypothetical protein ASAC_0640 [Acidilobus saccharovorans 345-15]
MAIISGYMGGRGGSLWRLTLSTLCPRYTIMLRTIVLVYKGF